MSLFGLLGGLWWEDGSGLADSETEPEINLDIYTEEIGNTTVRFWL